VLKSIADVGLVGFPNAGKSSLTSRITKARPKTAAYPFTTLHPQIGVIEYPTTVKGSAGCCSPTCPASSRARTRTAASGHRFLRHIERCALLLFLIDMAGTDARDPRDDYKHLLRELKLYDPAMLEKPRLVVANKMDVPEAAGATGQVQTQATPRRRRAGDFLPHGRRAGAAEERIVKARRPKCARRKKSPATLV
jgi:GTP-binding protein